MSAKRTVPAGVLDSGMASLATFIVGVQAVRTLDPVSLGAYALVFSGFTLLMEISTRLILLPAEIDAARRPRDERLAVLRHSLRHAAAFVVLGGMLLAGVAWFVPAEVPRAAVIALLVTGIPCTMVSPVQDHLRKVLHIGGRSGRAASVSAVQLAGVVCALLVLARLDVPAAWHPFGSLLFANIVSSAVAVLAWRRAGVGTMVDPPGVAALTHSGRWHLVAAAAPKIGGFTAASLVAHLAGAPALGYAEGARILARPVGVLSQGIKATLGPPLMRAGARADRAASRRLSRIYAGVVGGCGLIYLLVAGFNWPLNPLASLMPTAYVVPGVAAATIAVFTLDRVAGAGAGLQLYGAGQERRMALVEGVASVGHVIGGLTAAITGAFAIPLGYLITSAIRRPWLALQVRRIYGAKSAETTGTTAGEGAGGTPSPMETLRAGREHLDS